MSEPAEAWTRAALALDLLGIDPGGLGGLRLRARAGPLRDRFIAALPSPPGPAASCMRASPTRRCSAESTPSRRWPRARWRAGPG